MPTEVQVSMKSQFLLGTLVGFLDGLVFVPGKREVIDGVCGTWKIPLALVLNHSGVKKTVKLGLVGESRTTGHEVPEERIIISSMIGLL